MVYFEYQKLHDGLYYVEYYYIEETDEYYPFTAILLESY